MPEEFDLLKGKRILIVDDEIDVLDSLEELLSMCQVDKASTYEEAKKLLETQPFDIAVLDIMGVNGYRLLDIAHRRNITAVMLTAHAFKPEALVKSIKKGAASYLPKEEMGSIAVFLNDVLEARQKGESPWKSWNERLPTSYFEKRWGAAWQDTDKEFWESFRESIRARRSQSKNK